MEFGVETAGRTAFGRELVSPLGMEPVRTGGHEPDRPESIPQSSDLRLVLGEAMTQAHELDRRREVGTEHLLAGLISACDAAAELLRTAGLELRAIARSPEETSWSTRRRSRWTRTFLPWIWSRRRRRPGADSRRLGQSRREGLRVVEDYARFALDDPGLTRRLKEVRHRLAEAERGLDPTS